MFSIYTVIIELFNYLYQSLYQILIEDFIGLGIIGHTLILALIFILFGLIVSFQDNNVYFVKIITKPIITFKDKIVNMIIIIFFIWFYFFAILSLYYLSINIWVDWLLLLNKVINVIEKYGWINFILFIFLIGQIVYIFTLIIKTLRDVFKYHIIKRHIYNFYKRVIYTDLPFKNSYAHQMTRLKLFTIERLIYKILFYFDRKIRKSSYYIGLREDLYKIIHFIFYKGHYFIFCLFFLYDLIIYNGVIITYIFPLLIYIFIYETILKISNFVTNLYLPYDEFLHMFIYETPHVLIGKIITLGNNHKLSTGHLFVLLQLYLRNGLYYDPNKYNYDDLATYFDVAYTFNLETLQYKPNFSRETDYHIFEFFSNDELSLEARKKLFHEIRKLTEPWIGYYYNEYDK